MAHNSSHTIQKDNRGFTLQFLATKGEVNRKKMAPLAFVLFSNDVFGKKVGGDQDFLQES